MVPACGTCCAKPGSSEPGKPNPRPVEPLRCLEPLWCHRRVDSGPARSPIEPRLARLLDALHPDEFALRHRIAAQLDASMIDEIAAADYGNDVDQHRHAITELLAARQWPSHLDWHPLEVLELTRWSRPEVPDSSTGATGRRGHLMRIFACLVLIRVETPLGTPSNSLAPFVESAWELGPPIMDDALRYLAWCRRHEPGDWRGEPADRPFLTFGLLLLAAATRQEPEVLRGLADLLLQEVETALADEGLSWQIHAAPPLLGLQPQSMQRRMWRDLAGRCLVDRADGTDIGTRLALLGQAIRGQTNSSTSDIRWLFADGNG
jgi:hypothetical protein